MHKKFPTYISPTDPEGFMTRIQFGPDIKPLWALTKRPLTYKPKEERILDTVLTCPHV
jgi:hypothetical protein